MIFDEPLENASDRFDERIELVKVDAGTPTKTNIVVFQQVSTDQIQMAGFTGRETIFDGNMTFSPVTGLRFMELAFDYAGSTYALNLIAEPDEFDRLADVARYMAQEMAIGTVVFENLSSGSDLSKPGLPAMANDGESFLIVSCRDAPALPFSSDVIARFVSSDRTVDANEILVQSDVDTGNTGCRYTRPTVTFDGANYLVVYMTAVNGNRRIVAQRISSVGQIIDAQPIDVSQNELGQAFEPSSVFDGSRHIVTWHEMHEDPVTLEPSNQIRASFIGTDGIPTNAIVITDELDQFYQQTQSLYRTQVALGDSRLMIVWEPRFESETRSIARPIYAQIMDMTGTLLLTSPILIREDLGDNPRFAQVASDGQDFLVGWIEGLLSTNTIRSGQFGLYARQVSGSGTLLNGDATTLGLEVIPQASDLPKEYLNLSYNNGEYLFLWVNAAFQTNLGTYVTKVSQDLSTISPTQPVSATFDDTVLNQFVRPAHPAISYSTNQTLVIWPAEDGMLEGWNLSPNFPE